MADESDVINGRGHKIGVRALSKIQDFFDQFTDALDLSANAGLCQLAVLWRGLVHPCHFCRDADDIQRIFQIMHDRAGEATQHCQTLALEHFAHIVAVELAQTFTNLSQQPSRQRGGALDQRLHFQSGNKIDGRGLPRHGAG